MKNCNQSPNFAVEPTRPALGVSNVSCEIVCFSLRRCLAYSACGSLSRSAPLRAERAKLKSCKDDKIIAQGKRGTSAALGKRQKMISSLFSNLVWRAPQPRQTRLEKREIGCGVAVTQGGGLGGLALGCYGKLSSEQCVSVHFFFLLKAVFVFFWSRFLFVGRLFSCAAPACYPHANGLGAK